MRTVHRLRAAPVLLVVAILTGGATLMAASPPAHAACTAGAPTATPPTTPSGFHPINPLRVLDTRVGTGGPIGAIAAGCEVVVDLSSSVSPRATAVALTVTAVNTGALGYITAHPCDAAMGPSSNVNPRLDSPTPNLVVVPLTASRQVCLYTSSATDIIVDVNGWFTTGAAAFHSLVPTRVVDTRSAPRPDAGTGPIPAAQIYQIPLNAKTSTEASAVAVNLTVTEPAGPGYLTAFPCDGAVPNASVVNFRQGETRANQTFVGLSATGSLCVISNTSIHLVVDVFGWFGGSGGQSLEAMVGARVVDSRTGLGGWSGPIPAGTSRPIAPVLGAPPAVLFNITVTNATAPGYLVAYPCSSSVPPTSSVNYAPSVTSMNLVAVPTGGDGTVCIWSSATTDVLVDVAGNLGRGALRSLGIARSSDPTTALLDPSFSPNGHDYTLVCQAGSNSLDVTAVAMPGTTVSVNGGAAATSIATTVSVLPNAAVVIRTTGPGSTNDEYWIRCLPPDFPTVIVKNPGGATPGWYLYTQGQYLIIADDHGVPVWYRHTTGNPPIDLKRLPNGDLAWIPLLGKAYGDGSVPNGGYEVQQLDGTHLRTVKTVGADMPTDHHDLVALKDGNYLAISYVQRLHVNLTSLSLGLGTDETVLDGVIQEVTPGGVPVWSWNSQDHVAVEETQATNKAELVYNGTMGGGPVDLLHINSIDEAANGDVIVSARHLNSVFRIDRAGAAHKILWKLGGSGRSKDLARTLQIIDDPTYGDIIHQHDARLSADGTLLTLYDNRTGHPGEVARAVAFALDLNANQARLTWSYAAPAGVPSFGLGSVRRQSDGATVIGWANHEPLMQEVDADGTTLLQFSRPADVPSYRAVKEPLASFDRATLRATAGR